MAYAYTEADREHEYHDKKTMCKFKNYNCTYVQIIYIEQ